MAQKTNIMVASWFRTVATMTIITGIIWTIDGVYNALKKPTDLQIPAAILQPVSPAIDMDTLQKLPTRRQITDEVATGSAVEEALSTTMIEEVAPSASASAQATPEPAL